MAVATSQSRSVVSTPRSSRSPLQRFRHWLGGSFSPYIFIAPFFLFFFAFSLYPFLYSFALSFTHWHGDAAPRFIGLSNYLFLLTDSTFWQSLTNSAILWILIVPIRVLIAVLIAALLSLSRLHLRGLFRTIMLFPYVVPLVALAQVWLVLFDQDFGAINTLLNIVHLPAIGWLTTSTWAKPTVALLSLWSGSAFAVLIMLAAIQALPFEHYEAAAIDGASSFRQFFSITLPLLRRTIAFLVVFSTLGVIQMFLEPKLLTSGGPYNSTTTAGFLLNSYIANSDFGTGAANSLLLMILLVVLSLVMLRFMRAGDEG
jgi:ABC-type sugar transport systems, permease components